MTVIVAEYQSLQTVTPWVVIETPDGNKIYLSRTEARRVLEELADLVKSWG